MMTPKTWALLGSGVVMLILAASIVGGVTYLNAKWYSQGYEAAEAAFTLKLKEEEDRQTAILNRVEESYREELSLVETQNMLLAESLKVAEEEAKQDPFRDRPALSAGAVQRLNRIR